MSNTIITVLLAILIIVAVFTLGSALLIWSVNTLFGTSIAFTFWNFLAGFVLIAIFGQGVLKL